MIFLNSTAYPCLGLYTLRSTSFFVVSGFIRLRRQGSCHSGASFLEKRLLSFKLELRAISRKPSPLNPKSYTGVPPLYSFLENFKISTANLK